MQGMALKIIWINAEVLEHLVRIGDGFLATGADFAHQTLCGGENYGWRKSGMARFPCRRDGEIAPGASLQCIVLKTWWPVSADSTAISAVSVSRISPIMMMSGSWRKMERKALAKVRPISFLTGT